MPTVFLTMPTVLKIFRIQEKTADFFFKKKKTSQKLDMFLKIVGQLFMFYQVLDIHKKSETCDYAYLSLSSSKIWFFWTKELLSL